MNIAFSFRTMAIGLLLVSVVVAGRLAGYYRDIYLQAEQQISEQKKTLAQQQKLITILRTDDARNRALMAAQQQKEQQLRQQGEIYQRMYQDAIKNDECASRRAPVAVLDLLRGKDTATTGANRSVAP